MEECKIPKGIYNVLEQCVQRMTKWAFIVSTGIVFWLFNSFDRFLINGKLPFKGIYVGAFILFLLSMICVAYFKLSFLLRDWTAQLRRAAIDEAHPEVIKLEKASPKEQWESATKDVKRALEIELKAFDMSERLPNILREGIIYFISGAIYLIVFLGLFFYTYL